MQLVHRLLSTRSGTFAVAGITALLAAGALLFFLHRYRQSVNDSAAPVSVLVAKSLIQKGTPGDVVASGDLFQVTSLRKSELRDGAFTDPASLHGEVAGADIYPGQQLTASEFVQTNDPVLSKLSGDERAISVPVDTAHGLIGELQPGDHVDVYAGFNIDAGGAGSHPVLKLLLQDALVLAAPSSAKSSGLSAGSSTSNVSLRANPQDAAELAWAADNGQLWMVLRPQTGAQPSPPSIVMAETLLAGVSPVAVSHRIQRYLASLRGSSGVR